MNTSSQITPEQQIANQKAEIESLRRKAESLERELQKLVDPDSGEIGRQTHRNRTVPFYGIREVEGLDQYDRELINETLRERSEKSFGPFLPMRITIGAAFRNSCLPMMPLTTYAPTDALKEVSTWSRRW